MDSNQKKRIKDNIEEAMNEILISDSDHIYVQTGEIFANLSTDSANDLCEQKKIQLENNIKLINQELDQMKEEMSKIKVTLYAKFGNNINLEYDEEN
jgi:prefoldin subunit 4